MIPNRKAILEITIGLVVMAVSVQADPTFISTCPAVITSPGRYVLANDVVCGAGTGILIASSDVTLALEGHRITAGVGASYAISNASVVNGILTAAQVEGVSILGPGLITNGGGNAFSAGVLFFALVTQSQVNGITVLGSSAGIVADAGGNGDFSTGLTGLTFTANTLGRNGTGISMTNVVSSTISKNDVSGNGVGISIFNPSHILDLMMRPPLVVSHNIVNGNTGGGVVLSTGGVPNHTVTVQNNVVSGNGANGISDSGIALEITNNTSLANGTFDLFDGGVLPSCLGVWSGNTFFTANKSCIH